jgi:hypothetical protein
MAAVDGQEQTIFGHRCFFGQRILFIHPVLRRFPYLLQFARNAPGKKESPHVLLRRLLAAGYSCCLQITFSFCAQV